MSRIFALDGPLYRCLDKVWQLLKLNLLFLVSCLPLVTVGAGLTALFAVVFALQEEGTVQVGVRYWKAFKARLARSTQVWLLVVAVLTALVGAYFLLANLTRGSQPVLLTFMVLVAFLLLAAMPLFPLLALGLSSDLGGAGASIMSDQSLKNPSLGKLLRTSLGVGVGHVLECGGMFLLLALTCLLPIFLPRLWPLWLLFAGSLLASLQAWLFRRACGALPVRARPDQAKGRGSERSTGGDGLGGGDRPGPGRR